MRRTTTALLVAVTALAGACGVAVAEPAPAPVVAMITLTTMPNGWQSRVDLRPELEVFPDGRAIKQPDAISADRKPETPPTRLAGRIPQEVLSAALAETRAMAAVDLGLPNATEKGTRIIDFMPQPPDQDVHLVVYAPESTEGLNPEQQGARKRFDELYRRLLDSFVQDR